MSSNLGKEIALDSQPQLNLNAGANVQRPFKIQKIQIPPMESILHYSATHNPHGIGSSSGVHFQPSSPANQQNQTQNQSTHSSENQQQIPKANQEEPFFYYQECQVEDSVKSCQKSVIGKFLSSKIIPFHQINNSLMGIWGNPAGFKLMELEDKYYQIAMEKEEDIHRILKGSPWIVRNVWLVVHPWDRQVSPSSMNFAKVPLWIQLWGLPVHCKTATMGKALGSQLGEVLDSAVYELSDKATFVKIKVLFEVCNPIRAGMYIGNEVDGVTWIDFRFENLPMFCFHCGLVGHIEENCLDKQNDIETSDVGTVNPRGAWLRSNSYGRRVIEKKEKTFRSNHRKSLSGGQFSPVPKGLSDMMAKLRMNSETQKTASPRKQAYDGTIQCKTGKGTCSTVQTSQLKRKFEATPSTVFNTEKNQEFEMRMAGLMDKASQCI